LLLPIDKRLSFNRNRKAQVFKDLLIKIGQHIEKMSGQYTFKAKKRRKEMDLNQEIGIGSI
jgi:hypothetical protein